MVDDALALPLTPPQQVWMMGLLLVWSALLFGGFVLGRPAVPGGRRMPLQTRVASSGLLVLASLSWFVIAAHTEASSYAALVLLGMALGFAGDLLLAGILPVARLVPAGMLAFGLGHVAYLLAFVHVDAGPPHENSLKCLGIWLPCMALGAAGWWTIVFRGQRHSRLHWAALPYALLLAGMAAAAACLALRDPHFAVTAAGATLFVVSDALLAARLFGKLQSDSIHDFVWLTYGPAQMLIVYSVLARLRAA